jgi:plasmid stability protein
MADVLIRNLADHVVAAADAQASRLGLSRSEYLRRLLTQDLAPYAPAVTVTDLAAFAADFADLDDPEVMDRAWQ